MHQVKHSGNKDIYTLSDHKIKGKGNSLDDLQVVEKEIRLFMFNKNKKMKKRTCTEGMNGIDRIKIKRHQ